MKFVSIAILLFLIQVSASVINAVGVFDTNYQSHTGWFDSVDESELSNASYVQGSVNTDSFGFGDFVKGLWYFVKAVGLGVIVVPYTLAGFGLRSPFIYYFSIPVYFMYVLAIAQFIANRGEKNMR